MGLRCQIVHCTWKLYPSLKIGEFTASSDCFICLIWYYIHVIQYPKNTHAYPTHCKPIDCSLPGSSVHGILRQEYWSDLPFPITGNLPHPGIESMSLVSPALVGRFFFFFTTEPREKPYTGSDNPKNWVGKHSNTWSSRIAELNSSSEFTCVLSVLAWAAITEHHRLSGLTSICLFLIILEAGSLRRGFQQGQGLVRSFPFSPWTHRSLLLHSHNPKGLGPNSHKLIKSYLSSTDPISRYRHMGIRTSASECEGHNSVHSMIMQVKQFPSSLVSWPRTTLILSHPGPRPSTIVSVSSSKLKERQLGGRGLLPAGILTQLGRGWGQPSNCCVLAPLSNHWGFLNFASFL